MAQPALNGEAAVVGGAPAVDDVQDPVDWHVGGRTWSPDIPNAFSVTTFYELYPWWL